MFFIIIINVMLPLNLIYLRYFHDAVICGGVSASAKKNNVTQSTVSQAIQKLENSLGLSLIVHKPNRFNLTMDGKKLFKESAKLFQSVKSLEESLRKNNQEVKGKLTFGSSHSLALAVIPNYLKKVSQLYPDLDVALNIAHPNVIKEWVRTGQVDFGIVLDSEDLQTFHCIELYRGNYQFFKRKNKSADTGKEFLISETRWETQIVQQSYKKRYKNEMPVKMRIPSWELIAEMVYEGMGIGFIPDYVVARKPGMEIVDIKIDTPTYHIYAFTQSDYQLNYPAKVFLNGLQESIKKLLKKS